MNLLLTAVFVVIIDRIVPLCGWGLAAIFFKIDWAVFARRYGAISFPRTVLGVSACIPDAINLLVEIRPAILNLSVAILMSLFVISVALDAYRAVSKREQSDDVLR